MPSKGVLKINRNILNWKKVLAPSFQIIQKKYSPSILWRREGPMQWGLSVCPSVRQSVSPTKISKTALSIFSLSNETLLGSSSVLTTVALFFVVTSTGTISLSNRNSSLSLSHPEKNYRLLSQIEDHKSILSSRLWSTNFSEANQKTLPDDEHHWH